MELQKVINLIIASRYFEECAREFNGSFVADTARKRNVKRQIESLIKESKEMNKIVDSHLINRMKRSEVNESAYNFIQIFNNLTKLSNEKKNS